MGGGVGGERIPIGLRPGVGGGFSGRALVNEQSGADQADQNRYSGHIMPIFPERPDDVPAEIFNAFYGNPNLPAEIQG